MMIQSSTLALAILLKFILTFWWEHGDQTVLGWINVVFTLLIILATTKLALLQWHYLHHDRRQNSKETQ